MSAAPDRKRFLAGSGALVVAFAFPGAAGAQSAAKRSPAASDGKREAHPTRAPQYPDVDSWLAVDRNGDVTVFFGKAELGTGTKTAIAQLVADELDVPFARVRVDDPDTALTPNQGYTAGSQTLTAGATPVRQAAATARLALVEMAASRLGVAPAQIATRDGVCVVKDAPSRRVTYAALVGGRKIDRRIARDVAIGPAPGDPGLVGQPVPRVDLPGKVVGRSGFVHNLRLPGMLHARPVHPPRPGAKLVSYDESSLASIPEKITVVRKGDFLAVVARREWNAILAARALSVTWSGGTALPDSANVAQVVRDTPGAPRFVIDKGDVEAALRSGTRAHAATYAWPFQSHGSIGPSCAVADVKPGGARVWSATQGVYPLRGAIAGLLGMPPERVRVTYVEGSGCYGHNGADDASAEAAIVSQAVGAPVRLQYMRVDETRWDPKGPAMTMELRGALDARGDVAAWDYRVWTPSHSGRPDGKPGHTLPGLLEGDDPGPTTAFIGGDRDAPTNYAFPVQKVTVFDQRTAVLRQSALRGLGGTQNTFANESFMDELAHLANANPLDFRLRHVTDPRAKAVLEALRPDYRPGRGVAFVRYENVNALVGAVADVSVDRASGAVRVNHVWIAHDCGLIVNPDGLRNQIEGNVIQATSRALLEEVRFDAGGVHSVDWRTYPILRFDEVPEVTIRLVDRPTEKILGAGEATTTVVAPAIANAIFAQTGARLRTVPFTRAAVLAALRA